MLNPPEPLDARPGDASVSRPDDHLLERILQAEPAQSWLARLTAGASCRRGNFSLHVLRRVVRDLMAKPR
jgi:hypothetical protein